jgi:hypothetical protein
VYQITIAIQQHQRPRGEMFKLNLLQCLGEPTAVDRKTLCRGGLRLLAGGNAGRQQRTTKQERAAVHTNLNTRT